MIVCVCYNISDKTIQELVMSGQCPTKEAGAGSCCGCCLPFIEDMKYEIQTKNQGSAQFCGKAHECFQ